MTGPRFTPWLTGRLAACAALGVFVFCARAWLIGSAGSGLPFWDQWDAEAASLYLPWLEGRLGWADLFHPHNEHRVALTRVSSLLLFSALEGWCPRAQLFFNAFLHATTAAGIVALFWPALRNSQRSGLLAGVALAFSSTSGWQNALWGFQSQVYFASLLALIAIGGLVCGAPLSLRWWLGWSAAALALLANASGMFAACAVIAAWIVARMPGRPANAAEAPHPQGRTWIVGIGLVAAIVAAGVLFRVDAPHHAPLRARSTLEFFAVFTRCLSWPFVDYGWAAAVMQAPLVWLVAARWRQKEPLAPQELAALALGLFAVLHAVAIAFGRGAGLPDHRPLSRYQDPLLLGACAQLFALLRLNAGRIPVLVWSGTAAIGLLGLTIVNLTLHLPHKRAQDRAASALIGKYQHSGDYQGIAQDPLTRLLHPTDPAAVERMLTHATLRPYWPGEIRGKDHPRLMLARAGLWLTVVTGAILGAMIALLGAKTPLSTRA